MEVNALNQNRYESKRNSLWNNLKNSSLHREKEMTKKNIDQTLLIDCNEIYLVEYLPQI